MSGGMRHRTACHPLLLVTVVLLSSSHACSNDDSEEDPIGRFQQYLRFNTAHPNPNYAPAVSFLERQAESIGLQTRILEFVPAKPVLLLTWPGSQPSLPSVMFNSHLDSVPAEPEKWSHPPFSAVRSSDGKIFARGAQDDKCIAVQYLEAIRNLRRRGFQPIRTVHVSYVPDEEIGGSDGAALFVQSEEFRQLNVGFFMDEGQASTNDDFRVFYADRSPWNLVIRATGNPGHGSRLYDNSAMENLLKSMEVINNFREAQFNLVKRGLAANSEVISVNPVFLKAGIPSPTGFVMNMQPSEAEAGFNIRLTPTTDPDRLRKAIAEEWAPASRNLSFHISESGPLRDYMGRPLITFTNDSNPWWHVFEQAIAAAGGKLAKPEILASTTDARFIRQMGIPALGFSPMTNTPILLHDHNEYLEETVFLKGIKVCHHGSGSYLQFVDVNGVILWSRNGTYKAVIYNPGRQQTNFYLCVVHDESSSVIWSANRDHPVSKSGEMSLTPDGIFIYDEKGKMQWSTPKLKSFVASLHLTEMGDLVLLDQNNISVWSSFSHPTDTIVIGQQLRVGTMLTSAVSSSDLSSANYTLSVTSSDAVLQWQGSTYWKMSMGLKAFTNSNYVAEYLQVNETGVSLLAQTGSGSGSVPVVIIQVDLPPADFRMAKLGVSGQLIVSSFSGSKWDQEFVGPSDQCGIPFICGRVGLCTDSDSAPLCSCPSDFRTAPGTANSCIPSNTSLSLPFACASTNNSTSPGYQHLSYIELGAGVDYFAIMFLNPMKYGANLSVCQGFCSLDCSCLGIFYKNATGSCYLIHKQLGSVISGTKRDLSGYIKAVFIPGSPGGNDRRLFPLLLSVIFPVAALCVFATVGVLWWMRRRTSGVGLHKLGYLNSSSSGEMESFDIPGLPVRYAYDELKAATEDFRAQIGCGAFGSVYKGILPDTSAVAVKRITNLGVHGKREFCTEISIIGGVHHVNLVKLKGFCAQGRERLLVYEYMNRGSLDRSLFGSGPVLEWQERFDIALGTARGLAYLHRGCQQKIIHCDIKPENILLHDHFQAKISDFGLSKLLSPEQSSHFTTMRGTRGYLAPEWLTSSSISERTDVYSYGMVLFELVSGRKNCSFRTHSHSLDGESSNGNHSMSSSSSGLIYFPMFALEMQQQGRYLDLADPRLEGRVTSEEVERLVRIALCCVQEEPLMRPTMVTVIGMLEGTIALGQPRLESLNFLRFYGRRFAEASTIEDGDESSQSTLCQQPSFTSTRSHSPASISFISSQQISGPR